MNPDRDMKRMVYQKLKEMGFNHESITRAIKEHGYDVERCANFLLHSKSSKHKQLFVGMNVWYYSVETNDWIPANVVCITKQLVSLIFDGHDFRWLEKDSEHYTTKESKPEPLILVNQLDNSDSEDNDDNGEYQEPKNGEVDYDVLFPESVLGLELYSDEDGYNCIVGRCVSQIARQKVQPGSQIIQVNNKWLANYKFEDIRDEVKKAAQQPPLQVKFRIKKEVLKNSNSKSHKKKPSHQYENNYSKNNQPRYGNRNTHTSSKKHNINQFKEDEEKLVHPKEDEEEYDFTPHMTVEQAEMLRPEDTIDHRDDVGRFLYASIVDKRGTQLKIHYEGWNNKWDTWCDYKKEIHRFAAPKSISRKPNTRFPDLKIRDYVDINPLLRHKGWRVGQIRRLDRHSGQAQIVYKEDGQEFLYWAHLNNPNEIAQFMTKAEESLNKMQQNKKRESQSRSQSQSQSKLNNSNRPLPPTLKNKKLPPKPPRNKKNQSQYDSNSRFNSISSNPPSRPLPKKH